jgi:tRNA-binding protein
MKVDFGKFGHRQTVGRFTSHTEDQLNGKNVFGVLNFESREIGSHNSDFLLPGVQYPKAESGEVTIITPMDDGVKIGSKMF